MVGHTEDITIFTIMRHPNNVDEDIIIKTYLSNVSWNVKSGINISVGGYTKNNKFTISILEQNLPDGFVHPDVFRLPQNTQKKWTIKPGDVIVRGTVKEKPMKMAEITGKYSECFTVTLVSDNRHLSFAKNIRVEGD